MDGLLGPLVTLFGTFGVAVSFSLVMAFQNPDKAQRWGEMIWAFLARFHQSGRRKAVQFGVQATLTAFAADLAKELGKGRATPVAVEWAQVDESPRHFFAEDRVVIRLHSREAQDRNLMMASLFYVSDTLVRRAKRYLSKKQARSIDLYAVDRLLTRTSPGAADLLHEEVIGPECDADAELAALIVDYQKIDRRKNAFFPIFVRELNYLAQKVVVKPRSGQLITEVKELHNFLCRYADRIIGEEIPLAVHGRFLRCAVVIIARSDKREVGLTHPYVNYMVDLQRAGHETIYMVGSAETPNTAFMRSISEQFRQMTGWSQVDRREFGSYIRTRLGEDVKVRSALIVLRSNSTRDYVGEADEVPLPEVPSLADVEVEDDQA